VFEHISEKSMLEVASLTTSGRVVDQSFSSRWIKSKGKLWLKPEGMHWRFCHLQEQRNMVLESEHAKTFK